jgi:hypothetical protein
MKQITINYIPSLGSFLDEFLFIKWHTNDNDTITISYSTPEELFLLGYKFGIFATELNNQD